ncbi:hypothetical protein [Kytococcus sp. HMSC28H12]|uniref:hypothetical protein n=1 Tax=Kytococcus sp. HMSC28H12 TaxID=1581067 RepID=UPI0008A38574|nr:hypothetical protein [Kytococcus sp. HMSC28H12]OFS15256.1 hypothetical protein HMPREF3099_02455 [Kytococcus sp. HMSC28H12]
MSERPRRPAFRAGWQLDQHVGGTDPADALELSHTTAEVLVHRGRAEGDPEVTRRLVELVDELGLDALALLWADRPARSLPGALWRLYALRQWVATRPVEVSREYAAGVRAAEVSHAVAGVVDPPGPQEVRELADAVLHGVYAGDLAVALERAAAFCRVVSAGRGVGGGEGSATRGGLGRGLALLDTAEDLVAGARLWRAGSLV